MITVIQVSELKGLFNSDLLKVFQRKDLLIIFISDLEPRPETRQNHAISKHLDTESCIHYVTGLLWAGTTYFSYADFFDNTVVFFNIFAAPKLHVCMVFLQKGVLPLKTVQLRRKSSSEILLYCNIQRSALQRYQEKIQEQCWKATHCKSGLLMLD